MTAMISIRKCCSMYGEIRFLLRAFLNRFVVSDTPYATIENFKPYFPAECDLCTIHRSFTSLYILCTSYACSFFFDE